MKLFKTAAIVMTLFVTITAGAKPERPRLVVGLVVDQMRWDYLYYYNDLYREDGLKRMLNEGFSCENTMINYVPTVTAIGHASIYTGTTPAMHGIAGNNFFIDNREVYCCADTTVRSVGSNTEKGQMSPHYMLASTIGDELKTATDFRSKVIGVSLKDRAAILPAGHSADAAYWWDSKAKCFITSTYYMDKLPGWVTKFNSKCKKYGIENPMMEPKGITLTMDMAFAALDNEQLGRHDVTDMLTISVSTTDAMGHAFSTRGAENKAAYLQLDREIARLLDKLDTTIGRGNYLIFLSADHGAAHNFNFMREHKIPAGAWESWNMVKPLNEYLCSLHPGTDNLVTGENSYRFYLNHEAIRTAGLDIEKVKHEAIEWLLKDKRVQFAVDYPEAASSCVPEMIRERMVNGYNPKRSGDICVITSPQVFITNDSPDNRGTSHGAWNPYDAHIPLLFMGWNVSHGTTTMPTRIVDIAPTVCAMLHIQMPNAAIGTAIVPLTDNK